MLKLVVVCALVVICSISPNSAGRDCENKDECNRGLYEICFKGQCVCPPCFGGRLTKAVCGTDGKTYRGECSLRKKACETQNTDLAVASKGKCAAARSLRGCKTCPTQCPTWPNC